MPDLALGADGGGHPSSLMAFPYLVLLEEGAGQVTYCPDPSVSPITPGAHGPEPPPPLQ